MPDRKHFPYTYSTLPSAGVALTSEGPIKRLWEFRRTTVCAEYVLGARLIQMSSHNIREFPVNQMQSREMRSAAEKPTINNGVTFFSEGELPFWCIFIAKVLLFNSRNMSTFQKHFVKMQLDKICNPLTELIWTHFTVVLHTLLSTYVTYPLSWRDSFWFSERKLAAIKTARILRFFFKKRIG